MHPDLQRRVQRYGWDYASEYYEDAWRRQLTPAQDRMLEHAGLEPGDRVLETACGTGLVTIRAAEAVGDDGFVIATDLSDEMLAAAENRSRERGLENVEFRRLDAENLDVPDDDVDRSICSLGLMYVPDPLAAVSEMNRTLRPDGRAAAVVWGRRDRCGWAEVFPIVDRRVESDVCPLFFRLGTGDTLAFTFEEAGFEDVTSDRFSVDLQYDSDEEACVAAFWGGAVALAWRKLDEDVRRSANEEYLESIEPYRDGSGYAIPGEFVVVSGRATA